MGCYAAGDHGDKQGRMHGERLGDSSISRNRISNKAWLLIQARVPQWKESSLYQPNPL